jgi:TrmH family RNA methyltransferase
LPQTSKIHKIIVLKCKLTTVKEITSLKDPLLQNMRLCRHQNGRESLQAFLFEELFALEAALKNEWPLSGVVFQRPPSSQLTEKLKVAKVPIFLCSQGLLKKVYPTGKVPELIGLAQRKIYPLDTFSNEGTLLILDNIQHAGNLGTILRTAAAFNIEAIVIVGQTELYNRNTIRGAKEAFFNRKLALSHNNDCLAFLKENQFTIVTTSSHTQNRVESLNTSKKTAFILGNETKGVSPFWQDNTHDSICLPQSKHVESLNVSIAAGIILYEFQKMKGVL